MDADSDGEGDVCDDDDDGDFIVDVNDQFPLDPHETSDMDNDGVGDNSDLDRDGDGVSNLQDYYPNDPSEQYDTDQDGIGNNADFDDDNDGLLDNIDPFDLTPFTALNSSGPFNVGTSDITFNSPRGHEITIQLWYPTAQVDGDVVIYDNTWFGNAWQSAAPDCSEPRPVVAYSWISKYKMGIGPLFGVPSKSWLFAFAPDHEYSTLLDVQLDNFAEMMLARPVDIMESFDWLSQRNSEPRIS